MKREREKAQTNLCRGSGGKEKGGGGGSPSIKAAGEGGVRSIPTERGVRGGEEYPYQKKKSVFARPKRQPKNRGKRKEEVQPLNKYEGGYIA